MVYLNPNWVHINSLNLGDMCGTYADICDVDLGSHALWVGSPLAWVSLMVKNDFHHIWPCVKLLDGKVSQTTTLDWPHVVGVFVVVFEPITTFRPTKHSSHLIKSKNTRTTNFRTCKKDQRKGFIGFETIASMSKVIFYRWLFYIFLNGHIFRDVPFDHNLHIPSFTLQKLRNTSRGIYVVSIAPLFWPPCLNPSFHTKSTFEKGTKEKPCIRSPWNTLASLQIIIILINKAIKP